jgi:hypothetical protein
VAFLFAHNLPSVLLAHFFGDVCLRQPHEFGKRRDRPLSKNYYLLNR